MLVAVAAVVAMVVALNTVGPGPAGYGPVAPVAPVTSAAGSSAATPAAALRPAPRVAGLADAGPPVARGDAGGTGAQGSAAEELAVPLVAARAKGSVDTDFAGVHARLRAEAPTGDSELAFDPQHVLGVWIPGVATFRYQGGILRAYDDRGRCIAEGGWSLAEGADFAERVRGGLPHGVWRDLDPGDGRIVAVTTFSFGVHTGSRRSAASTR